MPSTVWKGFVSFGLVSFPVRLFAAARPETVHFHLLHKKDLSRVKEVWYCAKENKPIAPSDLVKGYESAKGEYVVLEESELKQVAPSTSSTMEVLRFVKSEEVDPIYFERSYYVAPDGKLAKPYALFLRALDVTKHSAIAKLSMHNREHIVLIRPADSGLILHTLFYANEIHREKRYRESGKTNAKELELAKSLVQQLSGAFEADEFHDTYRKNIERLVREKRGKKPISIVEKPRTAEVVDLMDALKRSLQSQNKAKAGKQRKIA